MSGPASGAQGWAGDVAYALACGMARPSERGDGFGWRIVPPNSPFWQHWRSRKAALKAAGYRVRRNVRGDWLVSRSPNGDQAGAGHGRRRGQGRRRRSRA